MGTLLPHPASLLDLGEQLIRYRNSLSAPDRSGLRIVRRGDRLSLAVIRNSGLRVVVDRGEVSLAGGMLPRFAVDAQRFRITTEASPELFRLVFRTEDAGQDLRRDPLAQARLRGIEAKRRILAEGGGLLSAGRVGALLGMSRQAVDKRRKRGHLLAVSLGRRGFGYPAWQITERGVLPHLVSVLEALAGLDDWSKIVFLTNANVVTNGRRPLDVLLTGEVETVIAAARNYGEQGSL